MPSIRVTNLECRDLPNADVFNLSDPYVTFRCGAHHLRTRTINNTLNPQWKDDTFLLDMPSVSEDDRGRFSASLHITVFDQDMVCDDFLGEVSFPLNALPLSQERSFVLPLVPASGPSAAAVKTAVSAAAHAVGRDGRAATDVPAGTPCVSFSVYFSPNPVGIFATPEGLRMEGNEAVADGRAPAAAAPAAATAGDAQAQAQAPGGTHLPALPQKGTRAPAKIEPTKDKDRPQAVYGLPVSMPRVSVTPVLPVPARDTLHGSPALVDLLHRYYDANADGGLDLREIEVVWVHCEATPRTPLSLLQEAGQYGPAAISARYGVTALGLHILLSKHLGSETESMAMELLGTTPAAPLNVRFVVDDYEVGRTLGSGKFAVVYMCERRRDGRTFALKSIDKTKAGVKGVEAAYGEREILNTLNHACVLGLHDFFETPYFVFFVLDLVQGGELFDRIVQLKHYSERSAAILSRNLLRTMAYVHSHGVAHRDIKPENVLLVYPSEAGRSADTGIPPVPGQASASAGLVDTNISLSSVPDMAVDAFDVEFADGTFGTALGPGEDGPAPSLLAVARGHEAMSSGALKQRNLTTIKVADFGFAVKCKETNSLTECCGTPTFIAPEVLEHGYFQTRTQGYGLPCDAWSCGVLVYILLCGYPPFHGSTRGKLFERIVAGRVMFHSGTVWDQVSPHAKDLIARLLVVDPDRRMSCQDALQHQWFADLASVSDTPLGEGLQESFRTFAARFRMKGAVFGVEAASRMRYLQLCQNYGQKANKAIMRLLGDTIKPLQRLDLSRNYIGKEAAKMVVALAHVTPHILAVNLSGNFLDDEAVAKICELLTQRIQSSSEPPSICELDFSSNPITAASAMHLVQLAGVMPTLVLVNLTDTAVPSVYQARLASICSRNASREPALSLIKRLRGDGGVPGMAGRAAATPSLGTPARSPGRGSRTASPKQAPAAVLPMIGAQRGGV
eukprot:TRINITY_DN911_c0_g3_i1.p1 TRINITY_DN911_c0_g3~~TRINITY_DN911_c0_g3_i1.p1  ORF type:complete len:962 (-),score=192.48 TRINITY_DN911_c0_g3_i1:188-3073(-)